MPAARGTLGGHSAAGRAEAWGGGDMGPAHPDSIRADARAGIVGAAEVGAAQADEEEKGAKGALLEARRAAVAATRVAACRINGGGKISLRGLRSPRSAVGAAERWAR